MPSARLGVLGLTTEFRHQTITPTLLASPDRIRLMIAKTISYTVISAIYGLVCSVVNIVMASIWLSTRGIDVSFSHGVADAFTSNGTDNNVPGGVHLLNPLVGGIVFAAWALGFVVLGGAVTLRRDIS